MSTWRSEMKKVAVISTSLFYGLDPGTGVECSDRVAFAQNAATELLQQSLFLRDGTDENVSFNLNSVSFWLKILGQNTQFCPPCS